MTPWEAGGGRAGQLRLLKESERRLETSRSGRSHLACVSEQREGTLRKHFTATGQMDANAAFLGATLSSQVTPATMK